MVTGLALERSHSVAPLYSKTSPWNHDSTRPGWIAMLSPPSPGRPL
jgi:hypothetical protein